MQTASGELLEHHGEKLVPYMAQDSVMGITCQVTDVEGPVAAVSSMNDGGMTVVFSPQGAWVCDETPLKPAGSIELKRENRTFWMDLPRADSEQVQRMMALRREQPVEQVELNTKEKRRETKTKKVKKLKKRKKKGKRKKGEKRKEKKRRKEEKIKEKTKEIKKKKKKEQRTGKKQKKNRKKKHRKNNTGETKQEKHKTGETQNRRNTTQEKHKTGETQNRRNTTQEKPNRRHKTGETQQEKHKTGETQNRRNTEQEKHRTGETKNRRNKKQEKQKTGNEMPSRLPGIKPISGLQRIPAPAQDIPRVDMMLERLRLPIHVTEARCLCGAPLDQLGRHRGACPRSGRLKSRVVPACVVKLVLLCGPTSN